MPTAEQLAYIGMACGAVLGIAAVGALLWKLIKRFLGWADFIDGAREFLTQAQGRPATRDDPGEPNLMEQVRLLRLEQHLQRETLDEVVQWRAGQRERLPDQSRRRGRPAI